LQYAAANNQVAIVKRLIQSEQDVPARSCGPPCPITSSDKQQLSMIAISGEMSPTRDTDDAMQLDGAMGIPDDTPRHGSSFFFSAISPKS
jgi:hypothetical protein